MVQNGDYLYAVNPWLYMLLEFVALLLLWFAYRKLKPQLSVLALLILFALQYQLA